MNFIMCVSVVQYLPPYPQAWIREAGTTGAGMFKEACERGVVPVYGKTCDEDHVEPIHWMPVNNSPHIDHSDDMTIPRIIISCSLVRDSGRPQGGWGRKVETIDFVDFEDAVLDGSVIESIYPPPYTIRLSKDFKCIPTGGFPPRSQAQGLTAVDFSAITRTSPLRVAGEVLAGCSALKEVSLAPFCGIQILSHDFLLGCSALTTINLQPLNNVTQIQKGFLSGCSSLVDVDLSPLGKVTSIGNMFMQGCSSLTAINIAPINSISHIPSSFLQGCSSLRTIDLGPMAHVTAIGSSFLLGCSSLKTVDIGPLSNVERIGASFFSSCISLTTVTNMQALGAVRDIPGRFFANCSNLAHLDMTHFKRIREVGCEFLAGCGQLEAIDLHTLSSADEIGSGFLQYCSNLKEVDITPLTVGAIIAIEEGGFLFGIDPARIKGPIPLIWANS